MDFLGDYVAEFGRGPDKKPRKRRARRFDRPVRMKYVPPNPNAIAPAGFRQGASWKSNPRQAPKSKPVREVTRKRRVTRKSIGNWLGNPIDKARAPFGGKDYGSTSVKPGGWSGSAGNRLRQTRAAAGNVARTRGGKIGIGLAIAGGAIGAGRAMSRRRSERGRTPNAYANNPYYRTPVDRNIRRAELGTRSIRNAASGLRAGSDVSREIRSWAKTIRELTP